MSATQRVMILLGAPLVLAGGLGVYWGIERGSAVVERVEAWARAFEENADPVLMAVGDLPVVSHFHVDGSRVGRLDSVILLRAQPKAVDSVRFVVSAEDADALGRYAACHLLVDPERLEDGWPLDRIKQVVTCTTDTAGLAAFGSVTFAGADTSLPLFLPEEHLPCAHMSDPDADACRDLRREMQRLRDEIRQEVRSEVRQVREQVRDVVR